MSVTKLAGYVPMSAEMVEDAETWRHVQRAIFAAAEEDRRLRAEVGPWHGPYDYEIRKARRGECLADELRRHGTFGRLHRSATPNGDAA